MKIHSHKGFTLIEVMIVVILIGVIAAIALPAYQNYAKQARRADAKTSLFEVQLALEKYRANNPSFTMDMTNLGYIGATYQPSKENYYRLSVTSAATASYTITAEINPTSAQADDACGTFSIIVTGASEIYTATGEPSIDCWSR